MITIIIIIIIPNRNGVGEVDGVGAAQLTVIHCDPLIHGAKFTSPAGFHLYLLPTCLGVPSCSFLILETHLMLIKHMPKIIINDNKWVL